MLLRAVALLIVMVIAISVIRGLLRMLQAPKHEGGSTAAEHLVKDPVCGTFVPQHTALSARNEFFCSEECRSKFLTNTR